MESAGPGGRVRGFRCERGGACVTLKRLLSTPSRWRTCLSGLALAEQSAPDKRDCMFDPAIHLEVEVRC